MPLHARLNPAPGRLHKPLHHRHSAAQRPQYEPDGDDKNINERNGLQPGTIRNLHGNIGGHYTPEGKRQPEGPGQGNDQKQGRHYRGKGKSHFSRCNGPKLFGWMCPITRAVTDVIDDINAAGGQAEKSARCENPEYQREGNALAPVAEGKAKCCQNNQIFGPLIRSKRADYIQRVVHPVGFCAGGELRRGERRSPLRNQSRQTINRASLKIFLLILE